MAFNNIFNLLFSSIHVETDAFICLEVSLFAPPVETPLMASISLRDAYLFVLFNFSGSVTSWGRRVGSPSVLFIVLGLLVGLVIRL